MASDRTAEKPATNYSTDSPLTISPLTRFSLTVGIQPLAQVLAGLEEGHELLGHRNGRAGAWIAADTRRAVLHREGAETSELHPVAPRQRLDDLVEDDIDDALNVAVIEVLIG